MAYNLEVFFVSSVGASILCEVRLNTREIGNTEQELLLKMRSAESSRGTAGTVWHWRQYLVSPHQFLWLTDHLKPSNLKILAQKTRNFKEALLKELAAEPISEPGSVRVALLKELAAEPVAEPGFVLEGLPEFATELDTNMLKAADAFLGPEFKPQKRKVASKRKSKRRTPVNQPLEEVA